MKSFKFLITVCFLAITASITSCKKEPVLPPDTSSYDPELKVTHTISEFLALNGAYVPSTGGDTTQIVDSKDVIISGIVVADDRSGNFYKKIVIQDSTGAISISIDAYSLYATMPVGRRIYVKANKLWLGYDGGLPELGYSVSETMSLNAIPGSEVSKFIIKGSVGHTITPDTFTLAQAKALPANYYNRLIVVKDVEFKDTTLNWTSPNATTNRDIVDCNNTSMVVRSSNYADFASNKLPSGRGHITAILTVYISGSGNKTPQLVVRSQDDAQMNGFRCGTGPVEPATMITIDSLRKMYKGSTIVAPKISFTGVVISDRDNKNTHGQNLIIQQGNRGILVRFSSAHSFDLGDSVIVNLEGGQIGEYNQLLQVGMVASGSSFSVNKASLVVPGKTVNPTVVTCSQLSTNFEDFESTLVKINNVSFAGGTTFGSNSGNVNLNDGTISSGTIKHYTAAAATFNSTALPINPVSLVGIVGQFNATKQVSIRKLSDVQ